MKNFGDMNPISQFIYFLCTACITMFCMNPVILALSFSGAVCLFILRSKKNGFFEHLPYAVLFILIACINPIFYHNGVTVLFFLNDSAVTLESVFYGISSAVMIIAVLYWFRTLSDVLTSDRLLYLFGRFSSKMALLLSMTMRYIPLFGKQSEKVDQTQRGLGLYRDGNVIDTIRGKFRVFSVMMTWGLENGIITADSMTARGYGIGKRSFFSRYKFKHSDAALLSATLLFTSVIVYGMVTGVLSFTYYPAIGTMNLNPISFISYISFGILAFLPSMIEAERKIKWRILKSKI